MILDLVHAPADEVAQPCRVVLVRELDALARVVDEAVPGRRVLVTDQTVEALWGTALRGRLPVAGTAVIPPGEAHKTLDTWRRVVEALLAIGVDRGTTVLAFGGGVVGDVAGFAAATALRGIPVAQLPTTVLAMADSALGGKTGVDAGGGKNLVGAFHPPVLVAGALEVLRTLPARERRSGMAEVVKMAALLDPVLPLGPGDPEAGLAAALRGKSRIVAADPRERGERALLNAGHTVGHAIEAALGFGVWTHGEAVAAGLVAEARFAVRLGVCRDPALPEALATRLAREGLPVRIPADAPRDSLLRALALDKKGRADTMVVPLPVRFGEYRLVAVPRDELPRLIDPS